MDQILSKSYARRLFFTSIILLVFIVILVRFAYIPYKYSDLEFKFPVALSQILDNLMASLIITIAIGCYLFWVTPRSIRESSVEIVEPRDLSALFDVALKSSQKWYYKGGCGRYFRTHTIPEMAKNAREQSFMREIVGVIIDPTDIKLCKEHADYRNSTRSIKEDGQWTEEKVRQEVLATILTVFYYQKTERLLRIRLSLSKSYSGFRIDLGDEYVILTREDRHAPAMRCNEGTYFYRSYMDEVMLFEKQHVVLKEPENDIKSEDISSDAARELFASSGMKLENLMEPDILAAIELFKKKKNPYA